MKYATLALITATALLSACSSTDNKPSGATAEAGKKWRYTAEQMHDIANENKLARRMFYTKPSEGKDAAWFDAVKRGDLATVKKMVAAGQDLEAKDEASLGQTALGWAAFIGYEDMYDYLVAQGADLKATDRGDVYNVLKSAALGPNTNIVKKAYAAIKPKSDLNDQTLEDDGETLIMVAASNGRLETVKFLLSQGANPNLISEKRNQSALSFACERKEKAVVDYLISQGAINHKTGKSNCQP